MANNGSNLPLAINLVGPMVFQINGNGLEVWLPDLRSGQFKHEAGIVTGLDSQVLDPGNHQLAGPTAAKPNETPSSSWPTTYCAQVSTTYVAKIYNLSALQIPGTIQPTGYISVQLPLPRQIAGLVPVLCQVKYDGQTGDCAYCATGVRLLYGTTNNITVNKNPLSIDIGDQDQQVEVSIIHHPVNHDEDQHHPEATSDWQEMGKMLGIDWDINFNDCADATEIKTRSKMKATFGAVNDCVSPIAMF